MENNLVAQANISAGCANENFKLTWFGCPVVGGGVEIPEGFTVKDESECLLLTRFEFDLIEGL